MPSRFPAESSASGADPAPDALRPASTRLGGDDSAVAALPLDLDSDLHFHPRTLLLTRQSLVLDGQAWPLAAGMELRLSDHAGVGTLELLDAHGRLAVWRFTLGVQNQATRLVEQFQRVLARHTLAPGEPEAAAARTCPQCHASLPDDSDECPACAQETPQPPPSTWVLLRLWRFARPYRWSLLAGFALTLASTAATLVPPYLTIPLMDRVLIPFQNGQRIDPWTVAGLLLGLLGAAVAAWGLGTRLEFFSIVVVLALTMSMPPMIGRMLGAGDIEQIRKLVRLAVRFVVVWQLAIGLTWVVASGLVSELFSSDSDVQEVLAGYLVRVPLSYSGLGVCMLMVSVCNALGLAMRALLVSTLRLFLCFLPLLWIGSQINGVYGLMSGALVGNLFAGAMAYSFYRAGMTRLKAELASGKA